MDPGHTKRVPWRSWEDFTGWAQDFSLMQKVLGGFLGVVVLVGLATSYIGTLAAKNTIMERARATLLSDLVTGGFVLKNIQEALALKVRSAAASETLIEALQKGDYQTIRDRLRTIARENDLDFLTVTDQDGRPMARAFVQETGSEKGVRSDAVVVEALSGKDSAGIRIVPEERLAEENPVLKQRAEGREDKAGMVIEAAQPLMFDSKIIGSVYGGIVVNRNNYIVDRIARQLFRDEVFQDRPIGYVAIFQGALAISSTLKEKDGTRLVGFRAEKQARDLLEGKEQVGTTWESVHEVAYLSAGETIKDSQGNAVGVMQMAIQERPIATVVHRLVGTFLLIGMFGVLLMGAITYFIVAWINRPLERMLHSARRAAEGDLSHEVPVVARDEVGELAATFNLMIRNLAESRNRLEQWGKELAGKVQEQTGQLHFAQEQVERVKKLASLEKMADGMAHYMAHISDPLGAAGAPYEDGATRRVLVLDQDEQVLEMCQRILENEGFEVKLAQTTEQALPELEAEFFDAVVMDIDMPDMDGKQLLKEIKYRQPDVHVIITASFKATEEAQEAVSMGAFDYLPKPFGPHQILLMIYTAFQTRQLLDKTRREHAQQRAETIFQRLPVAIALADKAHRVVYHNKAFIDLASEDGQDAVKGKTFSELFGVDPLEVKDETGGSRWMQLEKVGRTAKLYNFKLPEEDLRVLMLLDVTETVMKDQQADVFKAETISKAHQVIHQQMRVAQEIAGLLGETTAETKVALFELIKLAGEGGQSR